ncbi:hypothetical protein RF55_15311 [Lasius niger]|uniref:Uncharacterized protein n=1 Tax=Lasius niger TaxID=67767 RepID=A0A0J7MZK8_LASNI|nr:hypothetical protein RF55_15311 [Lasius niger]
MIRENREDKLTKDSPMSGATEGEENLKKEQKFEQGRKNSKDILTKKNGENKEKSSREKSRKAREKKSTTENTSREEFKKKRENPAKEGYLKRKEKITNKEVDLELLNWDKPVRCSTPLNPARNDDEKKNDKILSKKRAKISEKGMRHVTRLIDLISGRKGILFSLGCSGANANEDSNGHPR